MKINIFYFVDGLKDQYVSPKIHVGSFYSIIIIYLAPHNLSNIYFWGTRRDQMQRKSYRTAKTMDIKNLFWIFLAY